MDKVHVVAYLNDAKPYVMYLKTIYGTRRKKIERMK